MRALALIAAACLGFSSLAEAQEQTGSKAGADALVREGNVLGSAGRFQEAIAKFREADRLYSRALHDCNIGLAYTELKNWVNAHYFLTRCNSRWTEGQKPAWVAQRLSLTEGELKKGSFALVRLSISPAGASRRLSLFPNDTLLADSVWLPFGEYSVSVENEGFEPGRATISVFSKAEQNVQVELKKKQVVPVKEPELPEQRDDLVQTPPVTRAESSGRSTTLGVTLLSVGGALLIGGAGFHIMAASSRSDADKLGDPCNFYEGQCTADGQPIPPAGQEITEAQEMERLRRYDSATDDLKVRRVTSIALYSVGIVAAATGAVFLIRGLRSDDSEPRVGAAITPQGAYVTTEFRF